MTSPGSQHAYSVRTGRPAVKHVQGTDRWGYRAQNPESDAKFNASMTSLVTQVAKTVADAYDFSGLHTIVDVGGSHGALLITILRSNPGLHAVLFDLPNVVEGAREPLRAAGVLERCDTLVEICSRKCPLVGTPTCSRGLFMIGMTTAPSNPLRTAAEQCGHTASWSWPKKFSRPAMCLPTVS